MKYIFKPIIKTIRIKERFVCWLIDETKPQNTVIIITKLAAKFKEFNSGIPNGLNLSSTINNIEINVKIKNALFW